MTHEQDTPGLVFVTTTYGADYLPFLTPHLHSVSRCHPSATELVLWQDLPRSEVELLSRAFPRARFIEVGSRIEGDTGQRISRRLHAWRIACRLYPSSPLCFIDSDTLVVQRLDHFHTGDFDLLFTWKNEIFPINAGVLMTRNGEVGDAFFQAWTERMEQIVTDPSAVSKASSQSGAPDQHALRELIGFANYDGYFTCTVAGREFVCKGVECRFLNETNCTPITAHTHVIHYKGGWHSVLLRGTPFSENRPREECRAIHDLWIETASKAALAVARDVVLYAAGQHEHKFREVIGKYEERGILNSEMLAVCAVCEELGVEVIIESGRCRGQSTLLLAKYFEGRPVRIASVELARDENAAFAEERLASFHNVQLLYGDSRKLIPRLVKESGGRRMAILLDGPKGITAIRLVQALLRRSDDIAAVFIHDMRKGLPQRAVLTDSFSRVFFSDDQLFIQTYSELDLECQPAPSSPITIHTWRPFMKGQEQIASYGPTLGIVFPKCGEILKANRSMLKESNVWLRRVNKFYNIARHRDLGLALRESLAWAANRKSM